MYSLIPYQVHLSSPTRLSSDLESPRRVLSNAKAGHPQHPSEKKGVVVHAASRKGRAQGVVHTYAEHQHVTQRVEQVPEDKRHIGDPDFAFAIKDRCDRSHASPLQLDSRTT